MANFEVARIG